MLDQQRTQPPPPRIEFVNCHDLKLDFTRRFRLAGLLPMNGLVVIYGKPKKGKTFFAMTTLMAVARNVRFADRAVEQGGVVYCIFEGQQGLAERIEAYLKKYNLKDTNPRIPFFVQPYRIDMIKQVEHLIAAIKAQFGAAPPAVIALDTLNRSLVGSESSDEDMASYIAAADRLREVFNCVVVIVHHPGHNAERLRGHSSLIAAPDVIIHVERNTDVITATVEEARNFASGASVSMRLEPVEIFDVNGNSAMSAVAVEIDATVAAAAAPEANEENVGGGTDKARTKELAATFRDALNDALAGHGFAHRVRDDGPTVRAVERGHVHAEYDRRYQHRGDAGTRTDAVRRSFERQLTYARNRAFHPNGKNAALIAVAFEHSKDRDLMWVLSPAKADTPRSSRDDSSPEVDTKQRYSAYTGHRPYYQTIGPEPDHPCEHCGFATKDGKGEVYLIRDPFHGVASHALHQDCAAAFYGREKIDDDGADGHSFNRGSEP